MEYSMKDFAVETVIRKFKHYDSIQKFLVFEYVSATHEKNILFQLMNRDKEVYSQPIELFLEHAQSYGHEDPLIQLNQKALIWFQIPYELLEENKEYNIFLNQEHVKNFTFSSKEHIKKNIQHHQIKRWHLKIEEAFFQILAPFFNHQRYWEISLHAHDEDNMTIAFSSLQKTLKELSISDINSYIDNFVFSENKLNQLKRYGFDDKKIVLEFKKKLKTDIISLYDWFLSEHQIENIPHHLFSYIAIQESSSNDDVDFEDKTVFKGNKSIYYATKYKYSYDNVDYMIKPYHEDFFLESIAPIQHLLLFFEVNKDFDEIKLDKSIHQKMNYHLKSNEISYQQDGYVYLEKSYDHQKNPICHDCIEKQNCKNVIPSGMGKKIIKMNSTINDYRECQIYKKIHMKA